MVVSVSSRVCCFLFLLWRFRRVWPCWFLRRVFEGSPSLLVVLITATMSCVRFLNDGSNVTRMDATSLAALHSRLAFGASRCESAARTNHTPSLRRLTMQVRVSWSVLAHVWHPLLSAFHDVALCCVPILFPQQDRKEIAPKSCRSYNPPHAG